jgi:hypothetical protein
MIGGQLVGKWNREIGTLELLRLFFYSLGCMRVNEFCRGYI